MKGIRRLSPSLEDYLKSIYLIEKEKKVARIRDISKKLGVKAPSAISAVRTLEREGYVRHEKYGHIELTPAGKIEAERINHAHKIIKKFLIEILEVNEAVAEEDACMIEHYLHSETLKKISKFLEFVSSCPSGDPRWLKSFHFYLKGDKRPEYCGGNGKDEND